MPVLVPLVPPQILQTAPELVRLLDPPHFLPTRRFRLRRKLVNEPPQRLLQLLRQLLIVHAKRASARSRVASAVPHHSRSIRGSFNRNDSCIGSRKFFRARHNYFSPCRKTYTWGQGGCATFYNLSRIDRSENSPGRDDQQKHASQDAAHTRLTDTHQVFALVGAQSAALAAAHPIQQARRQLPGARARQTPVAPAQNAPVPFQRLQFPRDGSARTELLAKPRRIPRRHLHFLLRIASPRNQPTRHPRPAPAPLAPPRLRAPLPALALRSD